MIILYQNDTRNKYNIRVLKDLTKVEYKSNKLRENGVLAECNWWELSWNLETKICLKDISRNEKHQQTREDTDDEVRGKALWSKRRLHWKFLSAFEI